MEEEGEVGRTWMGVASRRLSARVHPPFPLQLQNLRGQSLDQHQHLPTESLPGLGLNPR